MDCLVRTFAGSLPTRPMTMLVTVDKVAYPALAGLGNETFLRGTCPG